MPTPRPTGFPYRRLLWVLSYNCERAVDRGNEFQSEARHRASYQAAVSSISEIASG